MTFRRSCLAVASGLLLVCAFVAAARAPLAAQATVQMSDPSLGAGFWDSFRVGQDPTVCTSKGADLQECATTVITVGGTVRWNWDSTGTDIHTATQGACTMSCTHTGGFDSGDMGGTNIKTFTTPPFNVPAAVIPYFCQIHTVNMTGTIIVQDYSITGNPNFAYASPTPITVNASMMGDPTGSLPYGVGGASTPVSYGMAPGQTFTVGLSAQDSGANPCTITAGNNQTPAQDPATTPIACTITKNAVTDTTITFSGQGTDPQTIVHTADVPLHVVKLTVSSPGTINVPPNGPSSPAAFTVTPSGTFPAGNIALACAGLPAKTSCGFDQPTVPNNAATMVHVTITGTGATTGITNGVTIIATPNFPSASIASNGVLKTSAGATTPATVNFTTVGANGLNLGQQMTVSGVSDPRFDAVYVISAVNAGNTVVATTADANVVALAQNTAASNGTINFAMAPQASAGFQVNVTPDYTISLAPASATVAPGPPSGNTFTATLTAVGDYKNTVAVTCNPASPSALTTCNVMGSPASLTTDGSQATVQIQAGNATVGQFTFSVHGVGNDAKNLTHDSNSVILTVASFVVENPSTSTPSTVAGNPTSPINFDVASQGAFSGTVSLSCVPSPANPQINCQFFPSASAGLSGTGSKVNESVVIDPGTNAAGTYTVNIHGASGAATSDLPLTLTVTAGSGSADMSASIQHTVVPGPGPVVQVGAGVVYTVIARSSNTSSNNATGIVMTAGFSIPVVLVAGANSAAGGTCTPGVGTPTNTVSCTSNATLTPGTATSMTLEIAAPSIRALAATANVSAAQADPNPANNVSGSPPGTPDVTQIRLRPFSRNGLQPLLP